MTLYRDFRDRKLQERAFLSFNYPADNAGKKVKVVLPMYETAKVTESEKARLVTYSPLGRAGNLYTYTGADSRKFNIEFFITLDHIIGFGQSWDKHVFQTVKPGRTSAKEQFKIKEPLGQNVLKGAVVKREFLDLLGVENTSELIANNKDHAISVVNYWVNIIRSSVINNSIDPVLGPPIVRLNYGILYRDVPCVCSDYSLSYDERAGYDIHTLLPKRIQVKLSLMESRVGNLQKFEPGKEQGQSNRDTLTGWESIIHHPYEIDPNPAGFRTYEK